MTFEEHDLGDGSLFQVGRLPEALTLDEDAFAALWSLHPDEYHEIHLHGRLVKTPRWQQAYGADYHYTGTTNQALPVPDMLGPLRDWCREAIDPQLNGILLNWYDPENRHYIGAHRDSTANMREGAPIVTISLGGARTFRLRPWKGKSKSQAAPHELPSFLDFEADHGAVFVAPYETNLRWTHEVPHSAKRQGRRISVTLRAFED